MRTPYPPQRAAEHRARLYDRLAPGEAVLVFGRDVLLRNADSEHRYRQPSDVLYLSGWEDPEVALFLRPDTPQRFVMFVQPRDPDNEVWTGVRPGPEGAVSGWGADAAYPIEELGKKLPDLLQGVHTLHYRFGEDAAQDRLVRRAIGTASRMARRETWADTPETFVDLGRVLHELRMVKSLDEIALLRRAAEITNQAHRAAMAMTRPGVPEYALEATIDHVFRSQGGEGPGYPSIVGGGKNSTILHYHANTSVLQDGDVVCVDAGCEYGFYTADVTRTWPVSGRFTEDQRALYEGVLDVQKDCIALCRPGVSWRRLSETAILGLTKVMVRLGLLKGDLNALILQKKYKKYYMHGLGHWLGLDVHDAGGYVRGGQSRTLQPGHVITIEPGIYVPADDPDAPPGLRGVGVRIEDDVLITDGVPDVLTAAIPKEIAEIEALVGTR